jgi:hypothetical protein
MRKSLILIPFLFAACGGTDTPPDDADAGTSGYIPFSASNLVAQQARVSLYEEISAFEATVDQSKCGDPAAATPAAGTILEVYRRNDITGGILEEKVDARKDDHTYNDQIPIGKDMNDAILDALAACHAGTLAPAVAFQVVEKNLQWFFYASVYHELHLGALNDAESQEKWDEAFGYYGRSLDGLTNRGISATAAGRDEDLGLTLNDTIYDLFIQGRDQLAGDGTGIAQTAADLDARLLLVFAHATAHEFIELPGSADAAEELAEGRAFFSIIEPYMISIDATNAAFIRAALDAATYETAGEIDAAGIVSRLETAFGIDATP